MQKNLNQDLKFNQAMNRKYENNLKMKSSYIIWIFIYLDIFNLTTGFLDPFCLQKMVLETFGQVTKARKVNCSHVYSAYTLKPVLFGRNL